MSDILAKLSALERMEGNLGYPVHLVGVLIDVWTDELVLLSGTPTSISLGETKPRGALIVKGPCGEAKMLPRSGFTSRVKVAEQ